MTKPLLALLLAPGLALAQTPFTYHISGKIGELNAPNKVYLTGGEKLDSATLTNGVFELKGTAEMPKRGMLSVQRNGWHDNAAYANATSIFLESSPAIVRSSGALKEATITGGPLTTEHQQLNAAQQPILDKMMAIGAENQKLPAAERETPATKERTQAQYKAVEKEFAQSYLAFIKAHPTSWVSLSALFDARMISAPQYAEVGPLYDALSPELKASKPGLLYGEFVQGLKATAIGQPAPNFTQKTPAGKAVSLSDYRGKYVLLDFWASWCKPCREENPSVIKAYQAFKGPKFDILGVSLDNEDGREKWAKAIADDHLLWTQVSDLHSWKNEAAKLYGIQSIPQNFLIDPSGKIIATNLKGAELQATLARYLK